MYVAAELFFNAQQQKQKLKECTPWIEKKYV